MTPFEIAKERLQEAKKVSLIGLIKELGYKLDSNGSYYTMLSPFNSESKGSFVIDKKRTHKFIDYSAQKKGDVLDFVKELFSYNHNEAVDYLLKRTNIPIPKYEPVKEDVERIKIESMEDLVDARLIEYLEGRKISINIAQRYLKQALISFPNGKNPDRKYLVCAFKNNSGGYEFRNGFFKIGNSPKDVTNIKGDVQDDHVWVFEGFPDFLSYLTHKELKTPPCNVKILNTISFLGAILPFIQDKNVFYIGQNDSSGNKAWVKIKESCLNSLDMRHFYREYKDYNDFICGKKKVKTIKQILNIE